MGSRLLLREGREEGRKEDKSAELETWNSECGHNDWKKDRDCELEGEKEG